MSTFTTWNGPQQYGPSMQNVTQLIDAYTNMAVNVADMQINITSLQHTSATNSQLNSINNSINNIASNYATSSQLDTVIASVGSKLDSSAIGDYYNKAEINDITNDINNSITDVDNSIRGFVTEVNFTDNISTLTARLDADDSTFDTLNNQFVYDTSNNVVGIKQPLEVKKDIEYTEYTRMNTSLFATVETDTHRAAGYVLGEVTELTFDSDEPKHARVYLKYINSKPFDATIDIVVTRKNNVITGDLKAFVSKSAVDDWKSLKFFLVEGTADTNDTTPRVWLMIQSAGIDADVRSNLFLNVAGVNFTAGLDITRPNGAVHQIAIVEVPDTMISGTVLSRLSSSETYLDTVIINNIDKTLLIDGNINLSNNIVADNVIGNNAVIDNASINNAAIDNVTANNAVIDNADITYLNVSELTTKPNFDNSPIATIADVETSITATFPIGAGIRWGSNTIPNGWLAAGTEFNTAEYPELASMYPDGVLPIEDNTIFLAKYNKHTVVQENKYV